MIYANSVDDVGLIVKSSGKYVNLDGTDHPTVNESLAIVDYTNTKDDPAVYGVVSGEEESIDGNRYYDVGVLSAVFPKYDGINRKIINSLGEGAVWVCPLGGNFINGDYITSSTIPGYGQKQDDNILHNYTVAKITCDMDFNNIPTNWKTRYVDMNGLSTNNISDNLCVLTGCTYHCG